MSHVMSVNFSTIQDEVAKYDKICEEAYVASKKVTAIHNTDWLDSPWHGFFENKDPMVQPPTWVDEDTLLHISNVINTPPGDGFTLHNGKNITFIPWPVGPIGVLSSLSCPPPWCTNMLQQHSATD